MNNLGALNHYVFLVQGRIPSVSRQDAAFTFARNEFDSRCTLNQIKYCLAVEQHFPGLWKLSWKIHIFKFHRSPHISKFESTFWTAYPPQHHILRAWTLSYSPSKSCGHFNLSNSDNLSHLWCGKSVPTQHWRMLLRMSKCCAAGLPSLERIFFVTNCDRFSFSDINPANDTKWNRIAFGHDIPFE